MSGSIEMEAELIERAIEERNNLLARAEDRAKRILASAEAEVERFNAETDRQILQLVGSELRTVRDRIMGQAELEGRRKLSRRREELLSSVFDEVAGRLRDISEGKAEGVDYGEILKKLVVEASAAIGGEEFIVSANKRDLEYLKKNIRAVSKAVEGGKVELADKPIDVMGGVVVQNASGTKIFYNTLEGRLERVRRSYEAEVAERLGVI